MEERKSNKGLIWLIVILIVLVLGLAGYIIYDKIILSNENVSDNGANSKNTTTLKNEENNVNIIDVNVKSEIIKDLYLIVPNNDLEVFSEDNYKGAYQNKKVYFKDLSTATILRTAMKKYLEENSDNYENFSINVVEDYVTKTFNNNLSSDNLKVDDRIIVYDSQVIRWKKDYVNCTFLTYDAVNEKFGFAQLKTEKEDLINSQKYNLINAEYNEESKEYYLYDKVYYSEIIESNYDNLDKCREKDFKIIIYDSYQKNNIIYTKTPEFVVPDEVCIEMDETNTNNDKNILKEIKENHASFEYKHTFKLNDNGDYYWYSSELAND